MRHYWFLIGGFLILFLVGYLNVLAFRFSWYWFYWWSDLPIHTLGALGLVLIFLVLGDKQISAGNRPERRELLLGVVALVMIMSGIWELSEFSTDRERGNHLTIRTPDKLQQGAADTATDLLADLTGVLLAGALIKTTLWRQQA